MTQPPPPPPYPPPHGALPPPPPFPPGAYAAPLPPRRRSRALPVLLAVVAAVLVVGLAVLVPVLASRDGSGDGDRSAQADPPPAESTLAEVEEFADLPMTHVPEGVEVDYPQTPPAGGKHAETWLECGVYDEPVPEANMVHSLEHGTVWITYRDDDVDARGIEQLGRELPEDGIMSPYPDQEAPVVITVWGRQLELTGPEDPRIGLFIAEYGAGDTSPEPFASCHGGVRPDDVGGGSNRVA